MVDEFNFRASRTVIWTHQGVDSRRCSAPFPVSGQAVQGQTISHPQKALLGLRKPRNGKTGRISVLALP